MNVIYNWGTTTHTFKYEYIYFNFVSLWHLNALIMHLNVHYDLQQFVRSCNVYQRIYTTQTHVFPQSLNNNNNINILCNWTNIYHIIT